jgi:hypothetical protein
MSKPADVVLDMIQANLPAHVLDLVQNDPVVRDWLAIKLEGCQPEGLERDVLVCQLLTECLREKLA